MQLKIAFFATLLATSMATLYAASDAEALFQSKCASCHVTTKPQDFSTLVAPPVMGVMRHVKMHYKTKEEALAFIVDYALDPQQDKALCHSDKIKHFELMPSQRGNATVEELARIASWMYDNFPSSEQKTKVCKSSTATTPKTQSSSQFLIPQGMPHLTKLLKQQWDNEALNLSKMQKEKLLAVRHATMKTIKRLTPRIQGLEKTIIRKTLSGESPKVLTPIIKKLALLKAEATTVHVQCIYDTEQILTAKQKELLYK